MDENQPQDQQPNPFAPGQEPPVQAAQDPAPTPDQTAPVPDQTQAPAPVQEENAQSATTAEPTSSDATANGVQPSADAPVADAAPAPVADPAPTPVADAPVADTGKQDEQSSTSPAQSSDESAAETVAAIDPTVNTANQPPVEKVDEIEQTPASAPQPAGATVVATGDPEQPVVVQQENQPATIPDPDPTAEDGAVIPNPNVITSQNTEVPSTLNPEATNTPAPMTPAERVAHIEIQQNTPDGGSVTETQMSGQYSTAADSQPAVASAEPTHESILSHLMKDLEGIAAMGKSEIIALLALARARYEDLTGEQE